jgi:hypothetical protein
MADAFHHGLEQGDFPLVEAFVVKACDADHAAIDLSGKRRQDELTGPDREGIVMVQMYLLRPKGVRTVFVFEQARTLLALGSTRRRFASFTIARAIRRASGTLPRWTGPLYAVAVPLISIIGLVVGVAQPIGAVLIIISGAWIASTVWARPVRAHAARSVGS